MSFFLSSMAPRGDSLNIFLGNFVLVTTFITSLSPCKNEVSDVGSSTLTSHSWSQGLQLESYLLTWVMLGFFGGQMGHSMQEWGKQCGIININLSQLISGFATWVILANLSHVGDFCVWRIGTLHTRVR